MQIKIKYFSFLNGNFNVKKKKYGHNCSTKLNFGPHTHKFCLIKNMPNYFLLYVNCYFKITCYILYFTFDSVTLLEGKQS